MVASPPETKPYEFVRLDRTKQGYEFAERKGVHSVAFVLYNRHTRHVGLRLEDKPPIGQWVLGAFGGSMEPGKSPGTIVKQEVLEEAGYKVTPDNIHYVGKYFVSTQMNQFCYLYWIDVSSNLASEPTTEDAAELISDVQWFTTLYPIQTECWKAELIMGHIISTFGA